MIKDSLGDAGRRLFLRRHLLHDVVDGDGVIVRSHLGKEGQLLLSAERCPLLDGDLVYDGENIDALGCGDGQDLLDLFLIQFEFFPLCADWSSEVVDIAPAIILIYCIPVTRLYVFPDLLWQVTCGISDGAISGTLILVKSFTPLLLHFLRLRSDQQQAVDLAFEIAYLLEKLGIALAQNIKRTSTPLLGHATFEFLQILCSRLVHIDIN
jgi:hypothetical protein